MRTGDCLLAALILGLSSVCAAEDERADALDVSGLLKKARAAADVPQARPAGAPVKPQEIPVLPIIGHSAQHHPSGYDIWSRNCHTQANIFAAMASHKGFAAGVLVCRGDPETSPQYHTASWAVEGGGKTCIYNWGARCCWDGSSATPDIATGGGLACAQGACGDQYSADETRAMPAGMLVESPGPQSCAISAAGGPLTMHTGRAITALVERVSTGQTTVLVPVYPDLPEGALLTFTPDRQPDCFSCCENRASMWSGLKAASVTLNLALAREKEFRYKCVTMCNRAFADIPKK